MPANASPTRSSSPVGPGPLARALGAEPERLHGMLDASHPSQWVVIDEIPRVPAFLDVVHQRLDREPARGFLLTGSSARALHRAGVNLLGGRAGRRVMPPFIAAELGEAFSVGTAQRLGLLPIVWTVDDPERALADYATVAVFDEVRAEARIRQIEAFARALEQLALSHGSVFSPTAVAQLANVKKSTVLDWLELLEAMFLVVRLPVFTSRPSRRALAAAPNCTLPIADWRWRCAHPRSRAHCPKRRVQHVRGWSTSISRRGAA